MLTPIPSRRARLTAVAGLGLLAIVVAACGTAGAAGAPGGSPSPSSPASTPEPSVLPSPAGSPSAPAGLRVPLDIATDHDVVVVIDDPAGLVGDATSGSAGDGMSVRWFDARVRNLDARTIEVTWVGLPLDDEVGLVVDASADGPVLRLTQKAPPVDSDAIGFDRVLVLRFAEPVDAGLVRAEFQASAA